MGACGVRGAKVERLLQPDSGLAVGTNALVKGNKAATSTRQIVRSIIIGAQKSSGDSPSSV
jgi:hypothetical protein